MTHLYGRRKITEISYIPDSQEQLLIVFIGICHGWQFLWPLRSHFFKQEMKMLRNESRWTFWNESLPSSLFGGPRAYQGTVSQDTDLCQFSECMMGIFGINLEILLQNGVVIRHGLQKGNEGNDVKHQKEFFTLSLTSCKQIFNL